MHESHDSTIAAHIRGAALRADDEWTRSLRDRVAPHLPGHEIGERLGSGGMGVVFRARQTELGRDVAVKVLEPPPEDRPTWSERFERETRALAKLKHPGIVAIHGFGEEDDVAWIVMELVEGASLRALMDAGALAPEEALAIAPDLCAALAYAHGRGIVHRDVKPENVLIDVEGRVKLVDFGIAKLAGDEAATQLTRTHQAMGTLRYMAPEQLDTPQRVDHRADIYSLGVVLYEMLTGVVPQGVIAPPSKRVEVDVRVDEVVLRSLEREPEHRYQRVEELAERVRSVQQRARRAEPVAATDMAAALEREHAIGMRVDGFVVLTFLGVAAALDVTKPEGGSMGTAYPTTLILMFIALASPLLLEAVTDPRHRRVPLAFARLGSCLVALAVQITFGNELVQDLNERARQASPSELARLSDAEGEWFTLFFNGLALVAFLPCLTAAVTRIAPRAPRWGRVLQGILRAVGGLLCVVAAALAFGAWGDGYTVEQAFFVALMLGVGFAAVRPERPGQSARDANGRAVAFASAGLIGLALAFSVARTAESTDFDGLRWVGALYTALTLTFIGGIAGVGSPRGMPAAQRDDPR